jgi:hypothetical protein
LKEDRDNVNLKKDEDPHRLTSQRERRPPTAAIDFVVPILCKTTATVEWIGRIKDENRAGKTDDGEPDGLKTVRMVAVGVVSAFTLVLCLC